MPGVFLFNLQLEVFDDFPKDQNTKDLPARKWWKRKYLSLPMVVLLGFLFFIFTNWNPGSAKIVNLPEKHPDFIGRKTELAQIAEILSANRDGDRTLLVAIHGEEGIGKTELAIAFGNDHLTQYSLIGWMDGSSKEALVHAYAKLGDHLGIDGERPDTRRDKIHLHLENNQDKPWLLIFDDLQELPHDVPKTGGVILVTCRDKSLFPATNTVQLLKNPDDALALLAKLTRQRPSSELNHLAEQLDYLPLMINLAGHYIINTPGVNVDNYSKILTETIETAESPLKWTELRRMSSKSLYASYLTTLQLLEKKHPLSFEFLKQATVLDHRNIPEAFLVSWLKQQSAYTPTQLIHHKGNILRELQNHSLIRYDEKQASFSFHRLLHHALALDQQNEGSVQNWINTLVENEHVKNYNPTHQKSIRPFQAILPHLLKIIEQIKRFDEQAVKLLITAARYFLETDYQLQKGRYYLDQAENGTQAWTHPIKGRIAFMQGMVNYREAEQSKEENEQKKLFQAALLAFDRAREIFFIQYHDEQYQGLEQNPSKCNKEYQKAICLQFQGQTLRALGRLDEAEKLLEQALQEFLAFTGGKEHFDIARILREQARILWEKEQHQEAIAKIESAIQMQKRVYGEIYLTQPTVASTHRILGDFYFQTADYAKALAAYQFAIDVNCTIYQSDDFPLRQELHELKNKATKALQESHHMNACNAPQK